MSNEIFRIRRLDDPAVHEIVMRAADAARAAASADGLSGEEVKVIPEFFGICKRRLVPTFCMIG